VAERLSLAGVPYEKILAHMMRMRPENLASGGRESVA
jgi:hypothetical protein